jgi:uncharacterized protein
MNTKQQIVWQGIDAPSMELLTLHSLDDGYSARSHILGISDGKPYRVTYAIDCDLLGEVKRVEWDGGELVSDQPGIWLDQDGTWRKEFQDCRTVDIRQTPFTNTLAVKYTELGTGMSLEIPVIYIDAVANTVSVDRQRYTLLSWSQSRRRYRFENASGYMNEIEVDGDDLVIDYPDLFKRLYPS